MKRTGFGYIDNIRTAAACAALALSILPSAPGTAQVSAASYQVLHTFTGGLDGGQPLAGLIQDAAGNLYGTTQGGGAFNFGVVFKLDTAGKETVLHSFSGGSDGAYPSAAVIRDAAGNLYGTTSAGGMPCIFSGIGCGVAFRLNASGKETVLHSFTGGADGAFPQAGLIRDSAGNLYGTTPQGGTSGGCGGAGCGVIFRLDATGKETVLYTFVGGTDGGEPVAGLTRDGAGNLYGTASLGGISDECGLGCGVIFKLDTTGTETVLYTFAGMSDGGVPTAGLVRDAAGNLYGTTEYRGTSDWGVVFKLDPTGRESVLHSFSGGQDGATPIDFGRLVLDSAGNLYGTAYQGGLGCKLFPCGGVVFKLPSTGKEIVLHTFRGADGFNPYAGLFLDRAGNLYGTTAYGGVGYGVVFKFPKR